MSNQHQLLIANLEKLLNGGTAHASLTDALSNLPKELRGKTPQRLPYSIWQLAEHIRIAQWDMLGFCKDTNHQSPKWPDDYWPGEAAPANDEAWDKTVKQITSDLAEFIELMKSEDVYKELQHGDGQTILHEALQMADHNAYHIAEIIVIRRLLGAWH